MTVSDRPVAAGPLVDRLPAVERRAAMPAGFAAAGLAAGIKASGRPDLALVVATGGPVPAAAVFTPNTVASAPVRRSKANLAVSQGLVRAIVSTSGCANAATGPAGETDQALVGEMTAAALGLDDAASVLHLSTGVIGTRLPLDKVERGLAAAATALGSGDEALEAAAVALRTTDSVTKIATTSLSLPGADGASRTVTVSGIAKGVGMIHPRMATMLAVILTDASTDPGTLRAILRPAAARTWDQLSVDGDTSTNDTVFLLASGAAGAAPVTTGSAAFAALAGAVEAVARDLARQQAADGEGATCLITCRATGAVDDADARAVARAVVSSSLVKAAAHGRDPNWGRIAGAAGNARLADASVLEAAGLTIADARARSGTAATLDPARMRIAIAGHPVYDGQAGGPLVFDKSVVRAAMAGAELDLHVDLGLGTGSGEAFGCDLTEAYVIENSEYTT